MTGERYRTRWEVRTALAPSIVRNKLLTRVPITYHPEREVQRSSLTLTFTPQPYPRQCIKYDIWNFQHHLH
jgi:hypothetical protein